jgi:hypothetical protein
MKKYNELEMEVVLFSTEDVIDDSPVGQIPVETGNDQTDWI